jgi:hypothetical protein
MLTVLPIYQEMTGQINPEIPWGYPFLTRTSRP